MSVQANTAVRVHSQWDWPGQRSLYCLAVSLGTTQGSNSCREWKGYLNSVLDLQREEMRRRLIYAGSVTRGGCLCSRHCRHWRQGSSNWYWKNALRDIIFSPAKRLLSSLFSPCNSVHPLLLLSPSLSHSHARALYDLLVSFQHRYITKLLPSILLHLEAVKMHLQPGYCTRQAWVILD